MLEAVVAGLTWIAGEDAVEADPRRALILTSLVVVAMVALPVILVVEWFNDNPISVGLSVVTLLVSATVGGAVRACRPRLAGWIWVVGIAGVGMVNAFLGSGPGLQPFAILSLVTAIGALLVGIRGVAAVFAMAVAVAFSGPFALDLIPPTPFTSNMLPVLAIGTLGAIAAGLRLTVEQREARLVAQQNALESTVTRLEATTESRDYVASVLDALQEYILITSAERVIVELSPRTRELGWGETLVGQAIEAVITEGDGAHHRFARGDGTSFPVVVSKGRVSDGRIVWAATDITDLNATADALRQAHQRSLAASAAKSSFLANMSHELRTPLNAIIGYAELVEDETTDPSIGEDLQRIHRAATSLLHLINGVLDLSKVESGKVTIDIAECSLADLLEPLEGLVRPLVQDGVGFEVDAELEGPPLLVDTAKVRQVLINLLSNAAKFTQQGTIRLQAIRWERGRLPWIRFEVTDSGVGMSDAAMAVVFEPFIQAPDASTTAKAKGTGLGLSICKAFVEMMGGQITVESELGLGSRFVVELPTAGLDTLHERSDVAPSNDARRSEAVAGWTPGTGSIEGAADRGENMQSSTLSLDELRAVVRRLLTEPAIVPEDWAPTATTYDIPRFHGGDPFLDRFTEAARKILEGSDARSALVDCGLPYDYARLGTPFSSVYELYLQKLTGAARAVSFASRTKCFLAPLEVPGRQGPARVYCRGTLPLSEQSRAIWARREVAFFEEWSGPLPADDPSVLTLFVADTAPQATPLDALSADAVACPVPGGGVLLIRREDRFDAKAIQLIRKRTVAALLASSARDALSGLLGLEIPPSPTATEAECDVALAKSLPAVEGAAYFCTGLAAEAAVFNAAAALLSTGSPVPLFYAENGYGGTGQLIFDILSADRVLEARPLPVMGAGGLVDKILESLEGMDGPAVAFIETPTNPQLQLHDFPRLVAGLKRYHARTGIQVPVLVDTTLAPLYPLFELDFSDGWPFLIVKSGSKYITRGKATMGLVLSGPHPLAARILEETRARGREADSLAKPYQLHALVQGVSDLRPRMETIAANTRELAAALLDELGRRGHALELYTMSQEQIDSGLHSGVLSFYLPPAPTTHADLVDEFVDWLLEKAPEGLVKNRVSYGQSRGDGRLDPFYVINPEESTQGALSAEVKEAQKRGGVQICRISVPQHADLDSLLEAMRGFFDRTYGPPAE